ncbi:H/ACA ribonucleoprotein complex non-core subunit NAF1 isoform X1 [Dermochelys coriacea]|uniref:H/ACA ribonucleoprotein complex non-core subunit NAF1 isoform X1 n=1 Tax=Dermochelys coriacea TaxID=27794 RepID=UPI0018E75FD1|nr:H/ACA ribonucleoprotein complex non-core subunit NAF1 isoform X1 [Dermochelys coriacea]
MEVVEQLETLKFDSGGAPGTPSTGGPQPGQEDPGGGEELGQASAPAAGGAPGAQGLQEEPPGESSADSDSDTDSDSSSSASSSSCSLSIGSAESDDGQQNGKDNTSSHVKTKDELPLEQGPPPVEDLTIILPEDVELKPFGTVSSIIEQLVIIESLKGLPPVNEESIIFKGDRHAAGKIYEIFGPVLHPFYVLLFNSPEHIEAKGINIQDTVYFAPSVEDFTQYIFTEKLKQEKGSDASWQNDQEPPPEALDFSDDEMERQGILKKKKSRNQERKKPKSEMNDSSEKNEVQHQPVQQPTSKYSRGYRGREFNPGFSRDRFPHPSVNPSFSRPQLRPPHLYSSDHRLHQESAMFPQPHRQKNPIMLQYPFPPPGFGPVGNEMHHFPPPNPNMMWTGPNMYSNFYSPPFPFPPPPPPPPPPASPNGHPSQFGPHS